MILLKRTCLTLFPFLLACSALAQDGYWQQQVNYTIDVSLNDKKHSIDGFERIEYFNHSPDTLRFIWFHIWPNAYKNDKTAFTDQQLENGNTKFYFSGKDEKGYINRLDFRVNNVSAETEDHPQHIDIIKLILPAPLAPGSMVTITTPFHVQLPLNFSRGGHDGESYQLTQWYPKPAVYDAAGWHPMPYLDQGEFYSEFGNFDVTITVPDNYAVAATGKLQDPSEKAWLLGRRHFNWEPVEKKIKTKGGSYKKQISKYPASSANTKTIKYKQEHVHDFAWFADKRYIVQYDTCQLASGKTVDVYSYYLKEQEKEWKDVTVYAKNALRTRSEWIGEYPFRTLTVVQGPKNFGGGMEYPTITAISPQDNTRLLNYVVAHEIGHNWFYGILGTNERQYPWMDEGFNTYYDNRYSRQLYPDGGEVAVGRTNVSVRDVEKKLFETMVAEEKDQPVNLPAGQYSYINYDLSAYYKTAAWLEWLETQVGREALDKAIRAYYETWKFKHPQPVDLKNSFEQSLGKNMDSAFALLDTKGNLPGVEHKGVRTGFYASLPFLASVMKDNSKTVIRLGPAIGLNTYDKLQVGLLATNFNLPPTRFQFLVAPMYATGSGKFAGTGLVNYSAFTKGAIQKVDVGISASTFSINEFKTPDNEKLVFGFHKIVPGIRLTTRQTNPRSTLQQYIQFKSFLISEESLRFSRDSIFSGTDTTIVDRFDKEKSNRTLNQLKLVVENWRVLYPYRAELNIEQGKNFIRAAFTAKYFFNYASGGGLNARLFAGKLFYTSEKTISKQIETDRYYLNMTGANGYEDYTYSDYFIGRNEFEGMASQQIMERDGAFKTRTDLLASKVGRTDDWLVALNFSTTIPPSINPLNLLPFKIPLKIFADVGTYAEAWKRDANTDRFLFDAGLHLPLLKETINIYLPLIYSSPFRDYIESTLEKKNRVFKKISFSIDLSNFSFRKFNRNLSF